MGKRLANHALRVAGKFTPLQAGPLHLRIDKVERVIPNALVFGVNRNGSKGNQP